MRSSVSALLLLFLSLPITAAAAELAPDFRLPLLDNSATLSLQEQRGKVIYLDFWASWCGPCRKSLPLLNNLRDELRQQGVTDFEILAINLDDEAAAGLAFLQEFPVAYPTLHDATGNTSQAYDLRGMPTSYLIDRQGRLRGTHQGFKPADMDGIRSAIEQLLQEQ